MNAHPHASQQLQSSQCRQREQFQATEAERKMAEPVVVIGVSITFLVVLSVVIDCVSLAVTVPASFKLHTGHGEAIIAMICNGVSLAASFFTLLFVTVPSATVCCSKANNHESNCCTPTYYVSIIVAELIAVGGTMVAGILLIFSVENYKDIISDREVATLAQAAAALNFTVSGFSVVVVVLVVLIWMSDGEKRFCCDLPGACAFIGLAALTVTTLVAALLTILYAVFVPNYSDGGRDSQISTMGIAAAALSGLAAGALLLGICIGSPFICLSDREGHSYFKIALFVSLVWAWAFLTAGTIASGGLMMKIGGDFATDESLSPGEGLNMVSVSAMAYLIGALNFFTTLLAFVVSSGAGFRLLYVLVNSR